MTAEPTGALVAPTISILAAAGPAPAEDFRLLYEGTVATLYALGIVGPAVGLTWPSAGAYEYEHTPDGNPADLCAGTGATAANGTPVTLQRYGVDARTLWIQLAIDNRAGNLPLISGTDTITYAPYVPTAGGSGQELATNRFFRVACTVARVQMWRNVVGVL